MKIDVINSFIEEDTKLSDSDNFIRGVNKQKGEFEFAMICKGANTPLFINDAAKAGKSPYITFMDSDSNWNSLKTEIQARYIDDYDIVTCSTLMPEEVSGYMSNRVDVNSWMVHRDTWEKIGGFNEELEVHFGEWFLGRIARRDDMKRLHIVCGSPNDNLNYEVSKIAKDSSILHLPQSVVSQPLVSKINDTINLASEKSLDERELIFKNFGCVPW